MSLQLQTGVMKYRESANDPWRPLIVRGDLNLDSLVDPYDATKTWSVGEYCLYDNALYICSTAVTTPGAWDASKWTKTTIDAELESLKDTLNDVESRIDVLETDVIIVEFGSLSSLPKTLNNEKCANITEDHVVLASTLGTPSAQTGDWTVETSNGSITVSGSISGTTTLQVILGKARTKVS